MRPRDIAFIAATLAFLWLCVWLKLYQYGQSHPDAFKEFLVTHQCYATARKTDAMGRKYTHYQCQNPTDNVDLYDMPR